MDSVHFLSMVPSFANQRETDSNIKVFLSTLTIYSQRMLSLKEMREGLKAFNLTEKHYGRENLPLSVESVQYAFRLVGKAMDAHLIEEWFRKCNGSFEY